MKSSEIRIVIPSRKRLEQCRRAFKLVPSATVCVAESDAEEYKEFGKALSTHPDSVIGLGPILRWMLDTYSEKAICSFDDDITQMISLVGRRRRVIKDPDAIRQVIENAANIAEGMNVSLFSFALNASILSFQPDDPFNMTKAVGPVQGFVGRRILPDPRLRQKDTDITLQALLTDRCMWRDTRFYFEHGFGNNAGGNRLVTTKETWEHDMKLLKKKWGRYVTEIKSFTDGMTMTRPVNVTRRSSIKIG